MWLAKGGAFVLGFGYFTLLVESQNVSVPGIAARTMSLPLGNH
jgi:hypothetical protein